MFGKYVTMSLLVMCEALSSQAQHVLATVAQSTAYGSQSTEAIARYAKLSPGQTQASLAGLMGRGLVDQEQEWWRINSAGQEYTEQAQAA